MLTRREVLTGTAAASIGAIASAHGVAAAAPAVQGGLNCGIGTLTDGVIARFDKPLGTIGLFLKFQDSAAELFYKPQVSGEIELFWKIFDKGWSKLESRLLGFAKGFGTDAYFSKVEIEGARFFFKSENDIAVTTDITFGDNGLDIFLKEEHPNDVG
jgi:hypothetical protein